jgi:hypothetical protein
MLIPESVGKIRHLWIPACLQCSVCVRHRFAVYTVMCSVTLKSFPLTSMLHTLLGKTSLVLLLNLSLISVYLVQNPCFLLTITIPPSHLQRTKAQRRPHSLPRSEADTGMGRYQCLSAKPMAAAVIRDKASVRYGCIPGMYATAVVMSMALKCLERSRHAEEGCRAMETELTGHT